MKRKFAQLCLDCDEIYSIHHRYCPICASDKKWMLGNWLGPVELNPKERATNVKDCDDCDPPCNSHVASSGIT